MKSDVESRRAGLPALSYLLLGFLAPIPTLRPGQVNLTWFDVALVGMGVLLFWRRVPRRIPGHVVAWGYLMVLGFVIAALRAPDPWSAAMHIVQWAFIFFVVVPVTYSAFRSRRSLWLVATGFVLAMAVIALYGLYEVIFLPKPYRLYRYGSILGGSQPLAFQISVTLPFLLFILKQARQGPSHPLVRALASLLTLTLSGTLIWLLAYSLSRTGAIATAAAFLAFAWLDGKGRQPASEKWMVQLSVVLTFLAAGIVVSRQAEITERIATRVEESMAWKSPEVADRIVVWQEALVGVDPTYYLIGVGPDNYHNISQFGRKPHAAFLLLLVEGGFLVVLAFVMLLAHFFLSTLAALRLKSPPVFRDFLVAAMASMVAYLVIAALNTQSIARFYWFVFALGLATASHVKTSGERFKERMDA
jgi:hypothetical protein